MSSEDKDVTEAISAQTDQGPKRRINFVPAKYKYTQNVSDAFVFQEVSENYSISYGISSKLAGGERQSLFDKAKINSIKDWEYGYFPLSGTKENQNRGFALSVLYALSGCPTFRQLHKFHTPGCTLPQCVLCKIFNFYHESEQRHEPQFPLEMRLFDLKYKPGDRGDSALFFGSLIDIMQTEELRSSRAFNKIIHTTAMGQTFNIGITYKSVCESCGRKKSMTEDTWYLIAEKDIKKELNPNTRFECDGVCDACGEKIYFTQEITRAPIVLTIQMPHWKPNGEFRRRNMDLKQLFSIEAGGRSYRLVAFTAYSGYSDRDGTFSAVFKASSGVWYQAVSGAVNVISANALNDFQPQLLFFSVDEENEPLESFSVERIDGEEDEAENDVDAAFEDKKAAKKQKEAEEARKREEDALEAIKKSIQEQLARGDSQFDERPVEREEPVAVVDTTNPATRRQARPDPIQQRGRPIAVANPMAMLMAKSAHSVGTWGEPVEREVPAPFEEKKPDEWDAELDKGHQRKLRKPKEAPGPNPFENAQPRRRPGDFGRDDRDRGNRRDGRDRGNRRDGGRGRGGFGRGRGGPRGGGRGKF